MLSLDEIKDKSIWVAKLYSGIRYTGLYKELIDKIDNTEIDDMDIVIWQQQPKELQPFYKAYEYAIYELKRDDLYKIDNFYEEWSKDPKKFEAQRSKVISKLSKELENLPDYTDLLVKNYDGRVVGNHHVGNFKECLAILDRDFDVIAVTVENDYNCIIIQCDDVSYFEYKVNTISIQHDKYLGDGKYWKSVE